MDVRRLILAMGRLRIEVVVVFNAQLLQTFDPLKEVQRSVALV